jgi:hypothetical protein
LVAPAGTAQVQLPPSLNVAVLSKTHTGSAAQVVKLGSSVGHKLKQFGLLNSSCGPDTSPEANLKFRVALFKALYVNISAIIFSFIQQLYY